MTDLDRLARPGSKKRRVLNLLDGEWQLTMRTVSVILLSSRDRLTRTAAFAFWVRLVAACSQMPTLDKPVSFEAGGHFLSRHGGHGADTQAKLEEGRKSRTSTSPDHLGDGVWPKTQGLCRSSHQPEPPRQSPGKPGTAYPSGPHPTAYGVDAARRRVGNPLSKVRDLVSGDAAILVFRASSRLPSLPFETTEGHLLRRLRRSFGAESLWVATSEVSSLSTRKTTPAEHRIPAEPSTQTEAS